MKWHKKLNKSALIQVMTLLFVSLLLLRTDSTFNTNTAVYPRGEKGDSAYQVWLDSGHKGSVLDFFEFLKGADGANGISGTNGTNGVSVKGDTGATGASGETIFTRTNLKTCQYETRLNSDLNWSSQDQLDPDCEPQNG